MLFRGFVKNTAGESIVSNEKAKELRESLNGFICSPGTVVSYIKSDLKSGHTHNIRQYIAMLRHDATLMQSKFDKWSKQNDN